MGPEEHVAHYRILSKLGEGGMGEVYRALDTKLNREVAIKILPEAFARDPERLARFTREAQVLASLNHPNIAAIYGVEERALVMELVEGEMLRGPVALETALDYAKQIAEALEYAHERRIIHRDLKPANIKVTREGRVKVLDFGLAKAMAREGPAGDPSTSPTLTLQATGTGVILGTAAYMSPEQARGQEADTRADIWSYGVVLYEMVTGRQLFGGATISDVLASVLKTEPDLEGTPAGLRPVIERCLRKDVKRRWQAIGDVRMALEEGVVAPAGAPVAAARRTVLLWVVAGLAGLLAMSVGWTWRATRPVDHPLVRVDVDLGPDALPGLSTTVAISPDGRRIVYPVRGPNGKQQLATRLLDQAQATVLAGTEDGQDPFFSPNSEWIGFFAESKLKKISVQGGIPVSLCDAPSARGGSWGEDGSIVAALASVSRLSQVPDVGGIPNRLAKLGGDALHRWPQILPGGQAVLFTASPTGLDLNGANIAALVLRTGATRIVRSTGYYGRYLPSGHLVYLSQGALFGTRFDPEKLEARGAPVPLVDGVAASWVTGGGQFDCSRNGTLIYRGGKPSAGWSMAWLDGSGHTQPLLRTPGAYFMHRLSPDGERVTMAVGSTGADIFVYDWRREAMTRLSFDGHAAVPVWSPDGKHIAYRSFNKDGFSILYTRADGAGEPHLLLKGPNNLVNWSMSPDGRRLAYHEPNQETGHDLWTLPLDLSDSDHPKPGKPEPFLQTPFDERMPAFSPDGRWIAYVANDTGADEIYVRPFPGPGGKWQISRRGGLYAFWSRTGKELLYESADRRIRAVEYTVNADSFVPGKERVWSDRQVFSPGVSNLDLSPDGKRFAILAPPEEGAPGSVRVTFLFNFLDELKRRLP